MLYLWNLTVLAKVYHSDYPGQNPVQAQMMTTTLPKYADLVKPPEVFWLAQQDVRLETVLIV